MLLLGLLATPLAAQSAPEIPALTLEIAPQQGTYVDAVAAASGYGKLRISAPAGAAWSYCRALAKATLDGSTGNALVDELLAPQEKVLGGALASCTGFAVPSSYLTSAFLVAATPELADDCMHRLLMQDGQLSPNAVTLSAAVLPFGTGTLTVQYEATSNHGWRLDSTATFFNLDAVVQDAIFATVLPALDVPDKKAFFNDPDLYGSICKHDVTVEITMVAVRGPNVDPAIATPPNPPLAGFPGLPGGNGPKLGRSSRVLLTRGGTSQGFVPPLHTASAIAQVPIYQPNGQGLVVMHASGFTPGMELALVKEPVPNTPPLRLEVALAWNDFGKVEFTMPSAPAGAYRGTYYRHRIPGPNGDTWSTWQAIPANQRPRILVP